MPPLDPASPPDQNDRSVLRDLSDARRLDEAEKASLRQNGRRRGRRVWTEQRDNILSA